VTARKYLMFMVAVWVTAAAGAAAVVLSATGVVSPARMITGSAVADPGADAPEYRALMKQKALTVQACQVFDHARGQIADAVRRYDEQRSADTELAMIGAWIGYAEQIDRAITNLAKTNHTPVYLAAAVDHVRGALHDFTDRSIVEATDYRLDMLGAPPAPGELDQHWKLYGQARDRAGLLCDEFFHRG
jgi:hypothetical protein